MRTRFIITLLLVFAMSLTTATRPSIARERLRFETEDEGELSKRDERDALELVARFSERLRQTHDFGQIADEMFVHDFSARLQQAEPNVPPFCFLNKRLVREASPGELRRYYVAAMNFFALFYSLAEASAHPKKKDEAEAVAAEESEAKDVEVELNFEEVLPPEIMDVLARDPTLALVIQELRKDEENESGKEDNSSQPATGGDSTQAASATSKNDDDGGSTEKNELAIIEGFVQLKSVSETLEKAVELMRQRLASLPAVKSAAPKGDAAKVEPETRNVKLFITDEIFFGYPKDTQFIHVDVLPFCLTLKRIDGQLKISSLVIFVD